MILKYNHGIRILCMLNKIYRKVDDTIGMSEIVITRHLLASYTLLSPHIEDIIPYFLDLLKKFLLFTRNSVLFACMTRPV
jgi:hypothetical protein